MGSADSWRQLNHYPHLDVREMEWVREREYLVGEPSILEKLSLAKAKTRKMAGAELYIIITIS